MDAKLSGKVALVSDDLRPKNECEQQSFPPAFFRVLRRRQHFEQIACGLPFD
jgi:hypothetical protein